MQTTSPTPTPAAIALQILEHGDWRGLAAQEMAAPASCPGRAIYGAPGERPRHLNGRFRSTRGDIAFAAA